MPLDPELLQGNAYQSKFCEENVYKLAERFARHPSSAAFESYVVFISTECKQTPIWYQKAGAVGGADPSTEPVVWDYHVVFLLVVPGGEGGAAKETLVLDADSTLPFPCVATEYCKKSFQFGVRVLPKKHQPVFRVVAAGAFLAHFASDRSHMRRGSRGGDGQWLAPPPPWPPIQGAAGDSSCGGALLHNLPDYWSVGDCTGGSSTGDAHSPLGTVMPVNQFYKFVRDR